MKTIQFAEGLTLHLDAVTQTIGLIARKGAGKTYAATKLLEGIAEAGGQFVACDPIGVYWGLRIAADGKGPGLDVVILGGLRGDIALDPNSGALIADAVMDSGRNFVLDVSQFSLGERKRFMTAFGERLWSRAKNKMDPSPIHVVLEECQLFLPQQPMPDERPMLGIWTEIVRLGRNKGVGVTLVTQRPQSVAKEALTQVELLCVLQVTGVPEKKALKEWIVEKDGDANLLKELPFLQRGQAYIWSPQWLNHFGKHQILTKRTFDSSSTPKLGEKRATVTVKPLDLDALRTQMADTVKKLEENDPKALRKRIAELERQLVTKPKAEPSKPVEVPVLHEKELRALERLSESLSKSAQAISAEVATLATAVKRVTSPAPVVQQRPQPAIAPRMAVPRAKVETSDGSLGRCERALLGALGMRHPNALSKDQMAILSGYSQTSSSFGNALGKLRSMALVVSSGDATTLTSEGEAMVADVIAAMPTTPDALAELWRGKLGKAERAMFDVVLNHRGHAVDKEQLSQQSGYSITSSSFGNALGRLRSLALVVNVGGGVAISEELR